MRILAMDLSKRSAGWACFAPDERVVSGWWELGSEYTSKGRTFGRLHEEMSAVQDVCGDIDAVFYEAPLNLGPAAGHTNIDTINVLIGLAMHAESWSEAMGCKIIRDVNQVTWRRHFIGSMRRGTKSTDLKEYAMLRCREYGFTPRRHDEAEAIGILTYACDALGIAAPWVDANPLVQQFGRK